MVFYFLPWVVFVLLVVIAVPIAAMLEKKKHPATPEDQFAGEDVFEQEEEMQSFEEVEPVMEEIPVEGGNDFSAFDDEFA